MAMAFALSTAAASLMPSRPRVLAAPLPSRPLMLAAPLMSRPLVLAGGPLLSRPRVLAAAALPSGRARRLGVGAGHGGASGRDVKAACAKDGVDPPSMGGDKQDDASGSDAKDACAKDGADPPSMADMQDEYFEKMYKYRSEQFDDMLGHFIPLPIPLSKEEKAIQDKLKEIAERCIALNYDAMRRLPDAERRRLGKAFWGSHMAFAVVRSRATNGRASMGMALVIAQKLYVVVEMVSFGCKTRLPLDIKAAKSSLIPFSAPVFPMNHGVEVLVFAMIENLYKAVKKDIDMMISGAEYWFDD